MTMRGIAGRVLEVMRRMPDAVCNAAWLAAETKHSAKAMPRALGRLRREGLIEETRTGVWRLTDKGRGVAKPEAPTFKVGDRVRYAPMYPESFGSTNDHVGVIVKIGASDVDIRRENGTTWHVKAAEMAERLRAEPPPETPRAYAKQEPPTVRPVDVGSKVGAAPGYDLRAAAELALAVLEQHKSPGVERATATILRAALGGGT